MTKDNSKLLISIITPTLNRVQFLEKTILSIKNQDYSYIEHIVIDGGSTDGTIELLKRYEGKYDMKWISEKDEGCTDAMSKGFKMAKGEVFAWLDADNYYNPGILKEVMDLFLGNPELDIVYGNVLIFDDQAKRLYTPVHPTNLSTALLKGCSAIPPQPGAFFRKKIYKSSGGFDTKYRVAADYDFWLKALKEKPKIKYLPICMGNFRVHKEGLSSNFFGAMKGVTETLRIGRKYNQSLSGKLYLCRGYLWIIKKFIFNLISHGK